MGVCSAKSLLEIALEHLTDSIQYRSVVHCVFAGVCTRQTKMWNRIFPDKHHWHVDWKTTTNKSAAYACVAGWQPVHQCAESAFRKLVKLKQFKRLSNVTSLAPDKQARGKRTDLQRMAPPSSRKE